MINFNRVQIFILLIVSVVSIITGYFVGYSKQPIAKEVVEESMTKTNPLFQFQTAIIPEGKVTALNKNILTVTNDKNQMGEFPLSKRLAIYKPKEPNSKNASSSSDIKSIELNQKATIVLSFSNGQFEVTEVSYIPQP